MSRKHQPYCLLTTSHPNVTLQRMSWLAPRLVSLQGLLPIAGLDLELEPNEGGVTEGIVRLIVSEGTPIEFRNRTKVLDVLRILERSHPGAGIKDQQGYEVTASHPRLKGGDYPVELSRAGGHCMQHCLPTLALTCHSTPVGACMHAQYRTDSNLSCCQANSCRCHVLERWKLATDTIAEDRHSPKQIHGRLVTFFTPI